MSEQHITEEQFSEWQATAGLLSGDKKQELEALIDGQEGKPSQEVQSEFESFLASLPLNFRTGLSKIVDVRNLTPEQLRGMVIANSIDGMDEVIRAAQYGDTEHAHNDRNIGQAERGGRSPEELEEDMRRDIREQDPDAQGRLPVRHVGKERLGTLSPGAGGGVSPAQEKGKGH